MHHGSIVYGDTIAALKQFQSGTAVLVGLKRPPPAAALAALPGVTTAESVEPTLFRVQFSADGDACDALVRRAVEENWGLYRLHPAQTSLEDVFVNLTRREENQ